jgi:hypothetical protein
VALAYPWYTLLGVVITMIVGGLLSLRHGGSPAPGSGEPEPEKEPEPEHA